MSTQISDGYIRGIEARPRRLAGDALIRYYCVAHRAAARDRSPITRYRDSWAFCANGYGDGHEWIPIEPISKVNLWAFGPTFVDRGAQLAPA